MKDNTFSCEKVNKQIKCYHMTDNIHILFSLVLTLIFYALILHNGTALINNKSLMLMYTYARCLLKPICNNIDKGLCCFETRDGVELFFRGGRFVAIVQIYFFVIGTSTAPNSKLNGRKQQSIDRINESNECFIHLILVFLVYAIVWRWQHVLNMSHTGGIQRYDT